MRIGTRSLLFGCHQFLIHPFFVAVAWWRLYGFRTVNYLTYGVSTHLLDWRLWVCFFVHDLGYWGSPNMDGPEGEQHPHLGARIVHHLFDRPGRWAGRERTSWSWHDFLLYHSRFLAKKDHKAPSAFCMADKLAITLYPTWLWVPLAWLTGEGEEYMRVHGGPGIPDRLVPYFRHIKKFIREWVDEHRGGRTDTVTVARPH